MRGLGGKPYFGLAMEWPVWHGLRSFPRRTPVGPQSAHLRRSRSTAIDPEQAFLIGRVRAVNG
jgi:hypothetical protein